MISPFKIESETEADAYLNDLLDKKEYRYMSEVEGVAKDIIENDSLRKYFIKKAQEILSAYSQR